MGNCLSTIRVDDTPERFQARWSAPGLADGLGVLETQHNKYASNPVPNYTTTANVGLGRGEQQYAYLHDKPPPLQLDRIDEEAALSGAAQASPMKPTLPGSLSPPIGREGRVQEQLRHWTKGDIIGQGAFGSVYLGMDNDTGQLIAVKQVTIAKGMHTKKLQEHLQSLEEEVHLLQQLEHPNIVRYLGTERTEETLNIFLEYVPGGSIASLVTKFGGFKESVIKVYTKQILAGLAYLHANSIMHRDIKGANILVDKNGRVKLADFGASKKLESLVTLESGFKSVKGTPYWMAPEVIQQTGHGREADIWSVACTVIEMATGKPPWSNFGSQVAAMFHIASSKGPPAIPEHLSANCKDFLYLCFNRAWKQRPSAARLLDHPFLADVQVPAGAGLAPVGVSIAVPAATAAAVQQRQQAQPAAATDVRLQGSQVPRGEQLMAAEAEEQEGAPLHTPSPLNPKLAAAAQAGLATGGGARISLAASEQPTPRAEAAAAFSPQLPVPGLAAGPGSGRWQGDAPQPSTAPRTSSPSKRSMASLRASAPVFSGYASVALSLLPVEPLTAPRPTGPHPSASGSSRQTGGSRQAGSGGGEAVAALRASREDGARSNSNLRHAASIVSATRVEDDVAELRNSTAGTSMAGGSSSSEGVAEEEPYQPTGAMPAALATDDLHALRHYSKSAGLSAAAGGGGAETPVQQQWAVHDLIEFGGDTPETAAAQQQQQQSEEVELAHMRAPEARSPPGTADSAGSNNSAGGFNPMEEPTWMQAGVLPLGGDRTQPANSAMVQQQQEELHQGLAGGQLEAASCIVAAGQQRPPRGAGCGDAVSPHDDHWVWTNDDGDIDALPWDVGGLDAWAASGDQELSGAGPPPELGEPVGEETLATALSHKAQLEVRKSLALFEKSLNVPLGGNRSSNGSLAHVDSPQDSPVIKAVVPCAFAQQEQQLHAAGLAAPGMPHLSMAEGIHGLRGGMEAVWEAELSRELQQWRMQQSTTSGLSVAHRRMSMHGSPQKPPALQHVGSRRLPAA